MNSKSQNAEAMTFHDILQCVTTIKISKKKEKTYSRITFQFFVKYLQCVKHW